MKSIHGFSNISIIKKAIAHLYVSLGSEYIESFKSDFFLPANKSRYCADSIISTQNIAADIAYHFRLPVTTVIVNYSSSLKHPGRVELGSGNEFFVEIQSNYRGNLNTVAGILAHEIAHIFLHRRAAEWPDTYENEILTDTTACLLGLGTTILNAVDLNIKYTGSEPEIIWQYFGYLSLDEFGYIIARRDYIHDSNAFQNLEKKQCKDAYEAGKNKYIWELESWPFVPRSWFEKFLFRENTLQSQIQFECPKCCKKLRIAILKKKVSVHCPVCNSLFICYS